MTRRTRAQARRRAEIWAYARAYLGVRRLPSPVVDLLNEVYDRPDEPIHAEALAQLLWRYRRPVWAL